MKTVFSGLQPTGNVHLGNYLGALRNWVKLQDDYRAIYCVVDLHAMTIDYDPADYVRERHEAARVLLACGIDPKRSLFYFQSEVPQHVELSWILATLTPMGVLNRMTQFKDKTERGGTANLGLFAYPVLMAADIMVHHAQLVPVGDDQRQHLEVTRDLAERFNNRYGDLFPVPEALIPETSARVMALTDPTAKMSKSDPNMRSRVLLLDPPDVVRRKIRAAVTDSEPTVRHDWGDKPGVSNLLEIMSGATLRPIPDLVDDYGDGGYGRFKDAVAEAVDEMLHPIRAAYAELDEIDVAAVMRDGAETAKASAEGFQRQARAAVGLANR
ncbi:MAG: tryptophan--tRNA ligase [Acidimicrobiia bacterium]|nr:tryptophan--tRNA ligase [Acidimicrobiia bacterium]